MNKLSVIDCLRLYTQINIEDINKIISKAPSNYKRFSIPKKNNSEKMRIIYNPSVETKMLQYILIDYYFSSYKVNNCAMAYIKGKSSPLRLNAEKHKKFIFSIHYDFSNFFYTIDSNVCLPSIKDKFGFSIEDLEIIKKICFFNLNDNFSLTIGSPISPILSNIYMVEFDKYLENFAKTHSCSYTRYSDDILFSSNDRKIIQQFKIELDNILSCKQYNNLKINNFKTKLFKLNEPKRITGLIITSDGKIHVPRKTKREVRTLIYKDSKRSEIETSKLKGLLSFLKDAEPEYINTLVIKYGIKYSSIFLK